MLTKDLVYFCEIAQRGSINRAAAALSVTQPTLTKSLQRLERELQVKLLERTSAGVSLTPVKCSTNARRRWAAKLKQSSRRFAICALGSRVKCGSE